MLERETKKLATRLNNLYESIYTLNNRAGKPVFVDFQKLPSRTGTDYYKYILKPISLHTVGRNVKKVAYRDAQSFIDDLAQITWNARHYNEPGSEIYDNALVLDNFIKESVIPRLASDPKVPNHTGLYYPDLGPLEDYDNVNFETASPFLKNEDYEDDEGLQYAHVAKVTPSRQVESGVRRGRPPIIDKPYESRIKLILKHFKKIRHPDNEQHILTAHFERLPDKATPGYYEMTANPISLHEIRTKVRSRKYNNVQLFLDDLLLMISNAKLYYAADPGMSNDILHFEKQAERIIEREMQRPEKEFIIATASLDGLKTPLDLVTVRNNTHKVGDWVLIRNPNDANKPICGQIFRLWATDGVQYTNVCWYIRPEQTCHRVDRLFYINEVCKTGEYRDHLAEDIVAPCYVIFLTHYQKGDIPPNLLPNGSEWFICEFRYNANTYVFNRIRTWKACLPDEIRHIDQPIVPINEPRKLMKYESPIRHLLRPDAHDDMVAPPPTQGPNSNGPPIVGSVYARPPYYNDELGQCSTSPNVAPTPDFDDPNTGRRAYIFTPVSQLKSVTGSGIYSSSGTRSVPITYIPGQPEDANTSLYDNLAYKQPYHMVQHPPTHSAYPPSTYKPYVPKPYRPEYSPSVSVRGTPPITGYSLPVAGGFHSSTSTYSGVLPGGVVSYVDKGNDEEETDLSELSKKIITSEGNAVWFRSPPVLITARTSVPVGHSAKYLAWKLNKSVK